MAGARGATPTGVGRPADAGGSRPSVRLESPTARGEGAVSAVADVAARDDSWGTADAGTAGAAALSDEQVAALLGVPPDAGAHVALASLAALVGSPSWPDDECWDPADSGITSRG